MERAPGDSGIMTPEWCRGARGKEQSRGCPEMQGPFATGMSLAFQGRDNRSAWRKEQEMGPICVVSRGSSRGLEFIL